MDESFYFATEIAELKTSAKQKLSKIIPVYDTLLSDPQIAQRIDKIAITAMPVRGKKSQTNESVSVQ